MSLLDKAFEEYNIINKTYASDGYGGTTIVWTRGTSIYGAMVFDSSPEMKIAQAMGSTSLYTFTVRRNVNLDYHTVIRRVSDGKIFRLTSNSDDRQTPQGAGLDMRQYSAEEFELTGAITEGK